MEPQERRMAIWRSLCCHRFDTVAHLAAQFGVSVRTIYYDVQILSLSYPIETVRGRYHGGVKLPDWYTPKPNVLTPAQLELLMKLKSNLNGSDLVVMTSIIEQFAE